MNISNHRYTYLLISCRRSGTTYLRKKRACSVLLRCSRIAISSFTEKEGFHTWHILKELRPGGRLLWKTGGPPRCKKIEGEKVTLPLQSLKTRRVPRCSATLNVRTHFISCSLIALLFDHFMKGKWIRRKKTTGKWYFPWNRKVKSTQKMILGILFECSFWRNNKQRATHSFMDG